MLPAAAMICRWRLCVPDDDLIAQLFSGVPGWDPLALEVAAQDETENAPEKERFSFGFSLVLAAMTRCPLGALTAHPGRSLCDVAQQDASAFSIESVTMPRLTPYLVLVSCLCCHLF